MGIATQPRLWFGALLLIFSAAALADNAMTSEPADLYAGPDNSYPVVAQLDPNTPIQVMGCLDDWSWCDVGVEDMRGWLYSPDITYAYEGGYVPLYSYAPALGIVVVPFVLDDYWGRYYHSRPWYPRREEWAHRVTQHRRPPGPRPSASLPPRPEHREGPREAAAPRHDDRSIHLGRAKEPPRPEPQNRVEPPRPESQRTEPPRAEPHALPAVPNPLHEAPRADHSPSGRAAPHAPPADHPHPEPPKHEDNPH